jgi:uncharacterized membrane protein
MQNQLLFKHFSPSYADHQVCSKYFSMIEDLAPSDSNVQMIVNKMADGTFHTIIEIKSFCGKFYSEAKELTSMNSIKSAKNAVLGKISEWKKLRYA